MCDCVEMNYKTTNSMTHDIKFLVTIQLTIAILIVLAPPLGHDACNQLRALIECAVDDVIAQQVELADRPEGSMCQPRGHGGGVGGGGDAINNNVPVHGVRVVNAWCNVREIVKNNTIVCLEIIHLQPSLRLSNRAKNI